MTESKTKSGALSSAPAAIIGQAPPREAAAALWSGTTPAWPLDAGHGAVPNSGKRSSPISDRRRDSLK